MNTSTNNFYSKLKGLTIALLGISFIIAIHELGHFTLARIFNIPVNTFSIGFGPTLFKTNIGDTRFQLALFPLGGYVQLEGENNEAPHSALNKSLLFKNRPYYQKVIVMLGGILFNLIFGISGLFFAKYWYSKATTSTSVERLESREEMVEESKSEESKNDNNSGFKLLLKKMQQTVLKDNNKQTFQGPVGIINFMAQASQQSFLFFIFFLSFLSINLAVFNILPFPPLDGGQIMLLTVEAIIGHPLSLYTRGIINIISLALFFLFFMWVTTQDIKGLFSK